MTFEIHDIVRLSCGSELVITKHNPNRPSNRYSGVLVNGHGKEYIFGDRHSPVKVGHAGPDHRALQANQVNYSGGGFTGTNGKPHDSRVAEYRASTTADPVLKAKWAKLASLNPGDRFQLVRRGRVETFTFVRAMGQGVRYHFAAANANGTAYKFPVTSIHLPGQPVPPVPQVHNWGSKSI